MEMLREKIDALLRQGADRARVELYHWELHRCRDYARLVVYIDHPRGVTVDDCARASRAMEALLDQADLLSSSYLLEVSSPGVERGLWERWHYERVLGKLVRVQVAPGEGEAVRTRYQGRLVQLVDDAITLDLGQDRVDVPLSRVVQAQVVYEGEGR
ncbi:MAG: ribosome maturation factor RimP [Candidatus Acetothermia bacterium]|jgi:ribosome maturation factor RimP|nr:ribosome maturation factor RimP [Candidatus Acetothermia bacterium]